MSEEIQKELLNELRALPKPELQKQVQNRMVHEILAFQNKHDKKQRRGMRMRMRKTFVGVATSVAIVAISLISYNAIVNEDVSSDKSGQQIEESEPSRSGEVEPSQDSKTLDPIDQKLAENKVAIGSDLYFGIPMKKAEVFIDRRVENDFTMVDIRDKKTNQLLYRYGESIGETKEKHVFREVQTKFSTLKIHAVIEIDKTNHMITSIKDTSYQFSSNTVSFEEVFFLGYSLSDKFPTELVEITLRGRFLTETEQVDLHEGYGIGVIK
jgi:hypothetical protein